MQKNYQTKDVVHCALFLAIGVALGYFSQMIPIGGSGSMRIGIAGFFYKMPSIIFGPLLGALVYGLKDFISYLIKPEGAYIFPMTISATVGGAISGGVFLLVKNRSAKLVRVIYIALVVAIGAVGIFNHLSILYNPNCTWSKLLLRLKDVNLATYGFYITFAVGCVFYALNMYLEKKNSKDFSDTHIKIFVTLFVSDIFITTVNTFILRAYYAGLGKLPFMVVYLPRLAEELILIFITSYVITCLYKLYQRLNKNNIRF